MKSVTVLLNDAVVPWPGLVPIAAVVGGGGGGAGLLVGGASGFGADGAVFVCQIARDGSLGEVDAFMTAGECEDAVGVGAATDSTRVALYGGGGAGGTGGRLIEIR